MQAAVQLLFALAGAICAAVIGFLQPLQPPSDVLSNVLKVAPAVVFVVVYIILLLIDTKAWRRTLIGIGLACLLIATAIGGLYVYQYMRYVAIVTPLGQKTPVTIVLGPYLNEEGIADVRENKRCDESGYDTATREVNAECLHSYAEEFGKDAVNFFDSRGVSAAKLRMNIEYLLIVLFFIVGLAVILDRLSDAAKRKLLSEKPAPPSATPEKPDPSEP